MKKFIILGLVVLFVFLSAQGIHRIPKPTRILGWLKIGGDFIPIWTEKYDIGDSLHWFDSSFIYHGQFKYLRVDSGGYLKLDSIDIDSLNISKLIGDYAYFDTLTVDSLNAKKVVVEDTIFTDFIAPNDSATIRIGNDGLTQIDSLEVLQYIKNNLWIVNSDSLWFTDGGADSTSIVQDGSYLRITSDNPVLISGTPLAVSGDFLQTQDGNELQCDGKTWYIDYDADDSLMAIVFGLSDSVYWDSIPEEFTMTAPLTVDGTLVVEDTIFTDFIAPNDSSVVYVSGDLIITGSLKPNIMAVSMMCAINTPYHNFNKNTEMYYYSGIPITFAPSDSMTLDSMVCLVYNQADSNIITNFSIDMYASKTARPATEIWSDATDIGDGEHDYNSHTWAVDTKIAPWDFFRIGFTGDKMAANEDVRFYNWVWYLSW